jgi:DNA-binding response OmpR family regulator
MARTILVVEDSDVCRDALELTFAKLPDFKVRTVATAQQALDYLAAENICALVTDLHLGPVDGFDLIARVRSHPRHASLPILVISADSDPDTPARLVGIGADAYFSKPYSPAAVCRKLEQLVHAH